jgi:hypothetical protein
MNPSVILQKREQYREAWVDLGDGKRLRFRRPLIAHTLVMHRATALEGVVSASVAWEGFTEADFLPSGGSDAVPFDADLWRDVAADRLDWLIKVDTAIADAIKAYSSDLKASLGNSPST